MTLSPADRARRRRMRGIVAAVIIAAWGASLAGLVRRDVLRTPAERFAEIAMRVNPGNFFYEVSRDGRRVGYASSTVDTSEVGDTLWIRNEIATETPGTRGADRAIRRTEVNLTRGFALRGFIIDVDSGDVLQRTVGRAIPDSLIEVVHQRDGVPTDTQRVPVSGVVLVPPMVPFATMLAKSPKVGRRATFTTYDPATQGVRSRTLRIEAESLFVVDDSARMDAATGRFVSALQDTVRAWRVVADENPGNGEWLDAQGRAVASSARNGTTLRRMAYELSFENWRLDALVTDTTTSASDVILTPIDPRLSIRGGAKHFVVRLTAPQLNAFDLNGGRQSVSGNVVTVTAEEGDALSAAYTLPPDAAFRALHRDHLQPEPFLQTRAPALLRQGIAIIGHERDPGAIVGLLTRWVTDSIARAAQPGDPDAAEILRARRGDAAGHAQLFVALARSLDIPTRLVSGAVRVDGRFYFHTWAEVFLKNWVAVDPMFGQYPADASHIRLATGGLEWRSALRRTIRSLHIDVVDAR